MVDFFSVFHRFYLVTADRLPGDITKVSKQVDKTQEETDIFFTPFYPGHIDQRKQHAKADKARKRPFFMQFQRFPKLVLKPNKKSVPK